MAIAALEMFEMLEPSVSTSVLTAFAVVLVVQIARYAYRQKTRIHSIPFTDATDCDKLYASNRDTGYGLRVVCISDTHNDHRDLQLPSGDVLIHAGDFTQYGKEEHARDFNAWLGEQPHRIKLVVLGNHESNAPWSSRATELLSNATLLRQSDFQLELPDGKHLRVFGTDFFWPCPDGNPYFDQIPLDTDILIAHGPAKNCADGNKGCPALLKAVQRCQPEVVISGHVHFARGACQLRHNGGHTLLVNAANCGSGKQERKLVNRPVVIYL